jgi:ATP-dependent RNA helicase RhlE
MPYNSRTSHPGRSRRTAFSARPSRRQKQLKDSIHPSRFIKAARPVTVEAYTPRYTFADFSIRPLLQKNIAAKGITAPSPIQDQAVPAGLTGGDVIGIANTGTGKTLAFAIPVLERLLADKRSRALIMAPTRELAQQIEAECKAIAKGSGLYGALLIGGAAMGPQLKDLRHDPSIVIGTPGRIKDHMDRGTLKIDRFNLVVLDEVDRMLDMGFVNDMRFILEKMSPVRQSFFFSATLDARVNSLIHDFSVDPLTISVKTGETTDNVEQNVVSFASKSEKIEKLHDLLIAPNVKALVFDDTQRSVERLSKELQQRGFPVDAIHGGKSQAQRQRALHRFKSSDVTVLVATDVAARGIDVSDITHVINYSTPKTYDDYVHRVGRAGRAGRTGYALTFIDR